MAEQAPTTDQAPEMAEQAPATDQAPEPTPASAAGASRDPERNRRKTREGVVASASMDRTAVVVITEQVRHRRYNKTVRRHKRLYVHDEDNDLRVGDRVRVAETRPLSKLKRWRLVQILERAR